MWHRLPDLRIPFPPRATRFAVIRTFDQMLMRMQEPIVITGIGLVTPVGRDREASWQAVKLGVSGVQRLHGFPGIADGAVLAAPVVGFQSPSGGQKNVPMALAAAQEAVLDSGMDLSVMAPDRFGSSIGCNIGDTPGAEQSRRQLSVHGERPAWWNEFLPSNTAAVVPRLLGMEGPRLCNSSACATGTTALIVGARTIRDGQCDAVVAGAAQTIHPILAAGFRRMRVLAQHEDPCKACRPFDEQRNGFVMGEGAGMFVLERLAHAEARGAPIYAELLGWALGSDAHHITDLSTDSTTLTHLLDRTLKKSGLSPSDVDYINAHGTGTLQNDVMETRGIRAAFRSAADALCVSSTKAILGHLLNAAGVVETALTVLALRDGFAPPTINLTNPDPNCDLDCIPLIGRQRPFEHAIKTSIAFGGHVATVALRRWTGANVKTAPDTVQPASRFAA